MWKLLGLLIVLCFSSCTSQGSYRILDSKYQFQFISNSNLPLKNITYICYSEGGLKILSEELADEINESISPENENGILVLHHKMHRYGRSYNFIGSLEWGLTPGPEVGCKFYSGSVLIHSMKLDLNKSSEIIKIFVKNI